MGRYVVGIDLGTTDLALADAVIPDSAAASSPEVKILPIPQLIAPKEVGPRNVLPSFLDLARTREFPADVLALPWAKVADRAVGIFARDHGARVPGRLVSSARSWLSHPGVDRRGVILPPGAPADVPKMSPVTPSPPT